LLIKRLAELDLLFFHLFIWFLPFLWTKIGEKLADCGLGEETNQPTETTRRVDVVDEKTH